MGIIYSAIIAVAKVGTYMIGFATQMSPMVVFATLGPFMAAIEGLGPVVGKRGEPGIESNVVLRALEPVSGPDASFIKDSTKLSLVHWDKVAGEQAAPILSTLCGGFKDGKVVDDEGYQFALDYWTANGTAEIMVPSGGYIKSQWIKEINEEHVWDCRDRYNELPPEVLRLTPKVLSTEQQDAIDHERYKQAGCLFKTVEDGQWKEVNLCYNPGLVIPKRNAMVKSYFSTLPTDASAVNKYTVDGADMLLC